MLTNAPKGTKDMLPQEAYKWRYVRTEFAKLAVILFLARVIGRSKKKNRGILELFLVLGWILPIVGLVGANNLSTAIIILGIAVILVSSCLE